MFFKDVGWYCKKPKKRMTTKMKILVTGGSGFIGTNYIELLFKTGDAEFLNLDKRSPRNKGHERSWKECNILDASRLQKIVKDFSPTHIVRLAEQMGTDIKSLDVFATNIEGVENLILASAALPSVERVIFTSSLLVCKMGYVPKHDTDYQPSRCMEKARYLEKRSYVRLKIYHTPGRLSGRFRSWDLGFRSLIETFSWPLLTAGISISALAIIKDRLDM